jgi:hypothetical protein
VNERDLGRHDEAIETLKNEVTALRGDIAEIKQILATAKGSWKTLIAVGGIAGAGGAGLFKILAMLKAGM